MFRNLRIGTRVLAGFGVVALLITVLSITMIGALNRIHRSTTTIYADRVQPLAQLKQVADAYAVSIVDNAHKVRAGSVSFSDGRATIVQARATIDSTWKAYRATYLTDEEQKLAADAESATANANRAVDHLLAILDAKDAAGLVQFAEHELYPAIDPVSARISALIDLQVRVAGEEFASSARTLMWVRSAAIATTLLVLVLCVGLGLSTARYLSRGVAELLEHLKGLREVHLPAVRRGAVATASGDLTTPIRVSVNSLEVSSQDELGELAAALNGVGEEARAAGNASERSRTTLQRMLEEAARVVSAAREGRRDNESHASQFDGAYGQLLNGFEEAQRAMNAPVVASLAVLERVALHDLSTRVDGTFIGEHARLTNSVNTAIANVADALGEVEIAAEEIASAAGQVASGSQQMADGASSQAASVEEITAALHEQTTVTQRTTTAVQEARTLASQMRDRVRTGAQSMQALNEAMSRMNDSATQTARIVKTIDEIAFQTNLLALNAAVEAARAGDAGRGFAVVADEVRQLAIRSADAARETAGLIEESVVTTRTSTEITNEVRQHLVTVETDVERVTTLVHDIASDCELQRDQLNGVGEAVERVNVETQKMAANAEESASASAQLRGHANLMRDLVQRFHVQNHAGDARPLARRDPRKMAGRIGLERRGGAPPARARAS